MKPARSDARNATAAATSSGCPKRFIGTARVIEGLPTVDMLRSAVREMEAKP